VQAHGPAQLNRLGSLIAYRAWLPSFVLEQVCGGVRRQLQELDQLLAPGETAAATNA
jgi:hypothetical protein